MVIKKYLLKEKGLFFGATEVFVFCFLASFLLFLPFLFIDNWAFSYAGDFDLQQISFYYYMNDFVKDGGTYSWASDLGSGALNTYSFYLSGSIFFLISLLFPSSAVPYLMAPLLMLKISIAGFSSYLFLRRYLTSHIYTAIGSILYAFSGFTIYSIFFNHFVDVIALFPFLLWSLDEAIYNKKNGLFAVFVAINLLNNYFFFVGQAVFLIIYFTCKLINREFVLTMKLFVRLAIETILGLGIGGIITIPAFISLTDNYRTSYVLYGFDSIIYSYTQTYLAIFLSWIFPPDSPFVTGIWTSVDFRWKSLSAYLPLCSSIGVFAYFKNYGNTWIKKTLVVSIIASMVPILNSLFFAFNAAYYARWFYMPTLIMCLATIKCIENKEIKLINECFIVFVIMLSTLFFAGIPSYDKELETFVTGLLNVPLQYYLVFSIGIIGVLIFTILNSKFRYKKHYSEILFLSILSFSIMHGFLYVGFSKGAVFSFDYSSLSIYKDVSDISENLPDTNDYRFDTYELIVNTSLWTDISSIDFFCSTTSPSILSFYSNLGLERDVISDFDQEVYALRSLLSVKYLIMAENDIESFLEKELDGWSELLNSNGYLIYENDNYIPIGFTYSEYITEEQFENIDDEYLPNVLIRSLLLTDEQILLLSDYNISMNNISDDDLLVFDYDSFLIDVENRKSSTTSMFEMNDYGFTAAIELEENNLVFFSVPYEKGFSAFVNGEEVEILNVDAGMMAIPCAAGINNIEFIYETYWLNYSSIISLICILIIPFIGIIDKKLISKIKN